jgi:hypothetical protein
MQDKDIKTSTYSQLFQPIFQQRIFEQLTELGVDKYVKKLSAIQLIQLIAHAQIQQQDNLGEITSNFYNEDFCRAIGLESISASQISRRLRTLPPDAVKLLFKQSLTELGSQIGFDKLTKELGRLHLIDSSTISLCLTRYPWAIFRQTKSGIKLHLRLQFQDGIALPGQAVITNAKVADKREMDELVVTDKDAINVFDRGYIDYRKFDQYCQKGIRFVTRLKWNALIDVVKDFPVNGSIRKDQQVYLGGNQTKMEHPLRLIEVLDT